ncbi:MULTISPECIES: galactokinase [unclassified Cryobacterium]|uniref:galactokinase n=2 Tax=Cryobacterium TaxID=69578 RepID=UPI002AB50CD4|nr:MULTISPECIES: galactokinase [unclassified Cryobacterium]MDY7528979.1 galactokinase [Cryobacterium sp. 10C2]MDY7558854.1 galactokinase [Cryobacterium sp. 10C3]MEB0200787.1 galactokinase [Cryobacterium sp. 5I3]MEB0285624.1 galactokinase [Cryobacterium sp. 10S3]MEB0292494.1 galactokinase [Cryobacterium sp. 10C2]
MSALDSAATAGFANRFAGEPDGLWSAPGRVNLIGEHTDYNDGFVLPFAIDRRTVIALAARSDRLMRVASSFSDEIVEVSLDGLTPDILAGWSAYPLGVAWALGEFGAPLSTAAGFDVYIVSDVPIGAGLSSSAAIESAIAVALNDVWGLGFDRRTLARVGQLAENRAVGAPTGIMDQSASLLGEKDSAVFLDCRTLESEVVPLGFDAAGLELLIIDTKVSHEHSTGGYASRRASCELGARLLGVDSLRDLGVVDLARAAELLDDETFRRVRHVITENQRVLDTVRTLRESGPAAIGALLDASHTSMRDDFEISVPELDLAVVAARGAGALGARMTGGGFGGAAIALTPHELIPAVTAAVRSAFADAGFGAPDTFVVRAADGAGREG